MFPVLDGICPEIGYKYSALLKVGCCGLPYIRHKKLVCNDNLSAEEKLIMHYILKLSYLHAFRFSAKDRMVFFGLSGTAPGSE